MFKIISDPTQYPIREADLSSGAGGLTLTPQATGRARDLIFERPDGGVNVARRARRVDLTLDAAVLEGAQIEALQSVLNLTDAGAPRGPGYIFPPFDASTVFSFPLQGSLSGWVRDPATETLTPTPAVFARASAALWEDKGGRFQSILSGLPRFTTGPLGRAIRLEASPDNLTTKPHPSSGDLVWSPGAGTPTLDWTTDHRSPYAAAGGCVRVTRATGSSCQFFAQGGAGSCAATVGNRFRYSFWVFGNVQGTVRATIGAQVETSAVQVASADTWTRWELEFVRTDAASTFGILVDFEDNGLDRTAFVGPHGAWEQADEGSPQIAPMWSDISTAKDSLTATIPGHKPGALTVTMASKIPPRPSRARLWFFGGGTDTLSADWYGAGVRFITGGTSLNLVPPSAEWDAAVGRPCVLTWRLGRNLADDGWLATLDVAYTLADGGPISRWTASQDPSDFGDYSGCDQLTLGGFGNREPGSLGLSWSRYDARTWTDFQRIIWERCILEAGFRDVFRLTQGRSFLLGDLELESIPGTTYQRGTLTATEQSVDSGLAVVT